MKTEILKLQPIRRSSPLSGAPNWRKRAEIILLVMTIPLAFSGCGLFRSVGDSTTGLFSRMAAGSATRHSALEEIEKDDTEYILDSVFKKGKKRDSQAQKQNQELSRQKYAEAEKLYEQGVAERKGTTGTSHVATLKKAAGLYQTAAALWINSTMEQDALFKAGESYFFANHFKKANDTFEMLIKEYPGTRHMDIVQARRFGIAKYWLELAKEKPQNPLTVNVKNEERPMRDTHGSAIRILDRMRIDDPTGKLADDATLALANAFFEKKKFLDAADTYEDLRVNFPNSEHQFNAHLFEMKSRLEAYLGPEYDGTHLETAEKLLKAIVSQFPNEADKHRELLETENARIRKMHGQRQMAIANYYEARGAYPAAGMYYREVLDEYANTPLAKNAEKRIAKISDKPATSGDPPTWVANLFPEPKPVEPIFGTSLKSQIR